LVFFSFLDWTCFRRARNLMDGNRGLTFVTASWKVRSVIGLVVELVIREAMVSSELLGLLTVKTALTELLTTTKSWGLSGRAELKAHSSSSATGTGAEAVGAAPPKRSKLEDAGAAAGAAGAGARDWNWNGLPEREFELERAAKGSAFFCAGCCCCCGEGVIECELGPEREPNRSVLADCDGAGWENIAGMDG
jgi:hypothetical protein